MGYKIFYYALSVPTDDLSGLTKEYYCDSFSDLPSNGLIIGEKALLLNEQRIFIAISSGTWREIPAIAEWGRITGTLSNQLDLQIALNGKQPFNPSLYPGLVFRDEAAFMATGTILDVRGARLNLSVSGSTVLLIASPDPAPTLGLYGWDEGIPVGTGAIMNFVGAGVTASISGTVLNVSIPGSSSATLIERNIASGSPAWQGKFVVIDANISFGSKINIWQAQGPYTGKGTRADEAEMDSLVCYAETATGSMTVKWRSVDSYVIPFPLQGLNVRGRVKGNFKFLYQIST